MAKQFRVTFKSKEDRKRAKHEAKRDIENAAFKNNLKKCEKEDKKTLIFTVKSKTQKSDLEKYLDTYDCTVEKIKDEEDVYVDHRNTNENINYFEPDDCHSRGSECHP